MNRPLPSVAPGWMSTPVRTRVTSPSVRAATFAPRFHSQWLTPVAPDRMDARIGEDDLQRAGDRGITVFRRPYVVPVGLEHD